MGSDKILLQDGMTSNIEFLYQVYSHTREMIQFFDTKAGAYVAVSGILASFLMSNTVQVLKELSLNNPTALEYFFLVILGVTSLVFLYQLVQVFYQTYLVLLPRRGPELVEKSKAIGLFWVGNIIDYLQLHSVEEYADTVSRMSERELITELSYEAAKLSQITRIKFHHIEKATIHFKWTILLWAILLLIVSVVDIILPHLS